MLKIKDNVNLRVLKKYKFEYEDYEDDYKIYNFRQGTMYVETQNRILKSEIYMENDDFDVLYDMIQDGIVEKVVE
jgi:hypothetical protein